MKRRRVIKSAAALAACISMIIPAIPVSAADYEFRTGGDGKLYWYEFGVKQGTVDDTQGILGDGTNRGREIYDPASDGWYWLDSIYDGAKAVGKEVWIPYIYQDELIMSADGNGRMANGISDEARIRELAQASITSEADMSAQVEAAIRDRAGKWVRYDENGVMLKGWVKIQGQLEKYYPDQVGNIYYYDHKTGLMAKGNVTINGVQYHFDEITGVLDDPSTAPDIKTGLESTDLPKNSEGYVIFGSYEQDGVVSNGKEPIEWIVVDENENGTLLVSRYVLDCVQYNTEDTDVTWETCSLRKWMNDDFLNTAFTADEQAKIATTNVVNADNPQFGTDGGNDTKDKIFCLSVDEILRYYEFDWYDTELMYGDCQDLLTPATPYAKSNGVYTHTITQYDYEYLKDKCYTTDCIGLSGASWLLRSPGYNSGRVCDVYYSGFAGAGNGFSYVYDSDLGVRPALYIAK